MAADEDDDDAIAGDDRTSASSPAYEGEPATAAAALLPFPLSDAQRAQLEAQRRGDGLFLLALVLALVLALAWRP